MSDDNSKRSVITTIFDRVRRDFPNCKRGKGDAFMAYRNDPEHFGVEVKCLGEQIVRVGIIFNAGSHPENDAAFTRLLPFANHLVVERVLQRIPTETDRNIQLMAEVSISGDELTSDQIDYVAVLAKRCFNDVVRRYENGDRPIDALTAP